MNSNKENNRTGFISTSLGYLMLKFDSFVNNWLL